MDPYLFYLLKSVVWLSSFMLVYIIFLRNERYFKLNRFFLTGGILSAFAFPAITFNYKVLIPEVVQKPMQFTQNGIINTPVELAESFSAFHFIILGYLVVATLLLLKTLWQIVGILQLIKKSDVYQQSSYMLVQSTSISTSFSFFSYVFVNPSVDKTEMREIMKHEVGHISQKHWLDLLLFECLRITQWFNPVVWFYGRLIRQNHEYLADEFALNNTENPGFYKATLLNQLIGGPVISLTNSFNYSLNQKRFKMMSYKNQSSIRKVRLLIILPAIVCIFYAFSEPNYVMEASIDKTVKNSKAVFLEQNSRSKVNHQNLKDEKERFSVGTITWKKNTVFSSKQLTKELGIERADKFTIEEINDKLIETIGCLYLDRGYIFFNARTNFENHDKSKSVDIEIDLFEGEIYKVGSILFEGDFNKSDKELKKIVSLEKEELFSRSKLIESVQLLTKKIGKDILPDVQPIVDDLQVDIIFKLSEEQKSKDDKLYEIKSITWKNNTVFSSRELTKVLGIEPGDGYSIEGLNKKIKELVGTIYLNRGYIFFNTRIYFENHDKSIPIDLVIETIEGDSYKVRNIKFEGDFGKTDEELKKMLALKEGDVFNRTKQYESFDVLTKYSGRNVFGGETILNNQQADVVFKLEKEKFTNKKEELLINSIGWKNNTVFNSEQLTKELGIDQGEVYTIEELNNIIREIIGKMYTDRGYSSFNAITYVDNPNKDQPVDIEINLWEGEKNKGEEGNRSIRYF